MPPFTPSSSLRVLLSEEASDFFYCFEEKEVDRGTGERWRDLDKREKYLKKEDGWLEALQEKGSEKLQRSMTSTSEEGCL